ncbi:MAG: hypothetical protein QOI55_982 [Actinomycetota bacterium]|nr:hypothetical protein [Actinomycetota bacterium]
MQTGGFIGRVEELRRFDGALQAATSGKPSALIVIGEAGVGKSRLAAQWAARARERGAHVLVGNCLQLTAAALPYAPIVEVLRALVRDLGADRVRELLGAGHDAVAALLPEIAEHADTGEIEAWGQGRLFEAVLTLLVRMSAEQPIVLVVEDLHWADHGTLDVLNFVVRNVTDVPVVIVGTERAEVTPGARVRAWTAELVRVPIVERVDLHRFGRTEIAALLTDILGSAPDAALAEEIYQRSEGNAFFAEELLAAAQGPTPRRLPETLRDTLLARVGALEPDTARVLHVIAVGGGRIAHDVLTRVAPVDETALLAALDDAVSNHVVVVEGDAYAFRHATFTDAIYGELLPGERRRLHARFAELVTTPAERAAHWSAAGDAEQALPATIEAARTAERQHAIVEAVAHWERALTLWEDLRGRGVTPEVDALDLRLNAIDAMNIAGEGTRGIEILERIIGEIDPVAQPHFAGRLQERLGWLRARLGDEAGSSEAYEKALELVPSDPPSVERSLVLAAIGRAHTRQRKVDDAVTYCRAAVDAAVAVGAHLQEGAARHALGLALAAAGKADVAFPELVRAASFALESGEVIELGWTCVHLLSVGAQAGRVDDGVAAVLDLAGEARRLGLERTLAGLLECIASSGLLDLGRWDEAERLLQAVEDRGPHGIEVVTLHLGQGTLQLRRGNFTDAAEHLRITHAMTLGIQDGRLNGLVYDGLADLARLEGRLLDARQTVSDGLRVIANTGDDDMINRLCLTGMLTEAAIAESRGATPAVPDDDVMTNVRRLRAVTERSAGNGSWDADGAPAAAASILTTHAEANRIAGTASPDDWARAYRAWTHMKSPYGQALTQSRLAEALFGSGRRDEGARELQTAHQTATALGAAPLAAEIEALGRRAHVGLSETGAHAELPADSGLTPRELDVLRLVAAGHTNRQIGAALFISEKTASVHVSRILTKLGVATRGQAAAHAHLRGLADEPAGR